jgi:competence protein ComGC
VTSADIQALREEAQRLARETQFLRDYGHTNRRLIWMAIISICLDLILTGWVTYNTIRASEISAQANRAAAAAVKSQVTSYQVCENTNKVRAEAASLWEYVIQTSEAQNEAKGLTPAQLQQQNQAIQMFRDKVAQAYAPQDCNHPANSPGS